MPLDAVFTPGRLRILVTGAAGLLGRELCGVLAGRGHGVVALLHRSRMLERNDGTAIPIRPYGEATVGGTIATLDGDVTAERFGLDPAVSIDLATELDLVVHCAAVTAFNLPQPTYDRVNVGGTAQVLAFAVQAGRAVPVLHVSTAYVCGEAGGVVKEASPAAARFNNAYEASKAAAEALALEAHRRGHPVAIARPSIVAGSWASGTIGAFGTFYQMVRLVAEGRIAALPALPGSSLNLVPIDHVVDALTDIAERMALADGRIFHLAASDPVPLTALEALTAEFPHLGGLRFMPIEGFDTTRLSPRQQWLHDQMKEIYASYLRPSPNFVAANLQLLSGRCCPPTDGEYLRRVIRYMVETRFLPKQGKPPAQRTSG
jgi:nucleoside-diphosphate-sugar epimerase